VSALAPPPPPGIDPLRLEQVLTEVRAQVAAALWLSAGMLLAFGSTVCLAAGWRRPGLCCALGYAVTLWFVPNGHAQVLGPLGAAVALAGLARPNRRDRT
jgi:hypothetical protein